MDEEIEERIQEKFRGSNIRILVEYENIRIYKITIIVKGLSIESGTIKKTIVFSYDWTANYTFDSNIQQLYYEIKNLLRKESINYAE